MSLRFIEGWYPAGADLRTSAESRENGAKRARDRKNDTRRKIIIGGIVQRVAEHSEKTREWLHKQIEKHVKSDRDRELFTDILKNK